MCRILLIAIAAIGLAFPASSKPLNEMFPDLSDRYTEEGVGLLRDLDFKQGEIVIGDGIGLLTLNEDFYYLDPGDASYVLTELWGNPEEQVTLGMIFPADFTPLDDSWGINILFDDIGYVSDEDAGNYDYDELLQEMRNGMAEENKWRRENNFQTVELVGWAAEPFYDAATRKLYWAKELSFEGEAQNTLNYNIRVLGRRGVLILNFIANMDQLSAVNNDVPRILAMADFSEGSKYSDFDPSIDTVAAVGIGGLIAGKVMAKTGIFVVALVLLKKFWFLLFLPLLWLKKIFSNRRNSG